MTFAERWRVAREEAGMGSNELDRAIGMTTGYTSRVERGAKTEPTIGPVAAAARAMNVSLEWLADGDGPMVRQIGVPDLPVVSFLMKMRRLPGLEQWLEENPGKLTVAQLQRGMRVYDEVKPASRADGAPLGGWGSFFADALAGRLTRALPGDQGAAETIELRRMSKAARRRMRSAPKKR